MWDKIIEVAATSGLWSLLFVALLFYQLTDSRKREAKYQKTIETLTERLEIVIEINEKLDGFVKKTTRARKNKADSEVSV